MPPSIELLVMRRVHEAEGIVRLELAARNGDPLPAWEPGAHIDLASQDAAGQRVQRQYSLCGEQGAATWEVAIQDGPNARGGARWLHTHAQEGQTLRASAPRNHFRLHDGSAPAILIAGGIGITPLMAMARALHRRGTAFRLHYHARDRSSAAFLDSLKYAPFADRVRISLDTMPESERATFTQIFADAPPQSRVYLCGPLGFMDAVAPYAAAAHIPPERIHRELFSPAPSADALPAEDRPFELQIRSTGQIVQVPADRTAVAALADAGVHVIVSCEQGLCGSCLTGVLEGTPEHRDQFLLPEEQTRNDCFTPCCSRAASPRLVLDL